MITHGRPISCVKYGGGAAGNEISTVFPSTAFICAGFVTPPSASRNAPTNLPASDRWSDQTTSSAVSALPKELFALERTVRRHVRPLFVDSQLSASDGFGSNPASVC